MVIDIKNLTKDYGSGKGVFDLSLEINEGEIMGFLGPNGAGKTTTIRHLMGFLNADSGECKILNKDCRTFSEVLQNDIGYLSGEINFIEDLKGDEFIKFVANLRNLKDLSIAHELTKLFELNTKILIKKMSKGMKQKLGIICAFMADPKIYILDEPTSGLDPLMQNKFIDLVLKEKNRGKTILMSSHIFEEIEKTCDRVAIIKEGKLVAVDSITNIKLKQSKTLTIVVKNQKDKDYILENCPCFCFEKLIGQIVINSANLNEIIRIVASVELENINIENSSLEDAFIHYYGG